MDLHVSPNESKIDKRAGTKRDHGLMVDEERLKRSATMRIDFLGAGFFASNRKSRNGRLEGEEIDCWSLMKGITKVGWLVMCVNI